MVNPVFPIFSAFNVRKQQKKVKSTNLQSPFSKIAFLQVDRTLLNTQTRKKESEKKKKKKKERKGRSSSMII